MRRAARLGALLLLLISLPVFSAISFPELTGRVVDNADMIDAATEQQLTQMLAAHEQNSTNQVVVVTVNDLQGTTIEDFGYQLGRTWGIGQKNADNGALLLVAKDERKVRIEVGYGLEGVLTDAISANIIDRKSTRLNSSHVRISYAVFCLKKKKNSIAPLPVQPRPARARPPSQTSLCTTSIA